MGAAAFSLPFLLLTLSPPTFSTAGKGGGDGKEGAHLSLQSLAEERALTAIRRRPGSDP